MAHPYDPYIPTEDDKEYMKEQYDKLKKKKGKGKGLAQKPVLDSKDIYGA